ncbi:MAG: hypothetical protein ACFBSC_10565 [Microcoleaceae cyanobacterium]
MNTSETKHAIGTFLARRDAEHALRELRDIGFDMDKISIVSRNAASEEPMTDVEVKTPGEQAKGGAAAGAAAGATTGGIMGLIGGLGILAIPGVGPVAELGVVLANTLLGSGIGAAGGGMVGALIGWGVPEDRARYYDQMIAQGRYILLMEGTQTEVDRAEEVLRYRNIQDWGIYNATPAPLTGLNVM